jgi:hypothetical protein
MSEDSVKLDPCKIDANGRRGRARATKAWRGTPPDLGGWPPFKLLNIFQKGATVSSFYISPLRKLQPPCLTPLLMPPV